MEKGVTITVNTTLDAGGFLMNKSGETLGLIANNMNRYLNISILKRISNVKKNVKILKSIVINAKNRFGYESSSRFSSLNLFLFQVFRIKFI